METHALVCLTFSTRAPRSHFLLVFFVITEHIFAVLQRAD